MALLNLSSCEPKMLAWMLAKVLLMLALDCVRTADATPLDEYVGAPSPHYAWHDTGVRIKTLFGGVGHVLNVTSQQWLDSSRAETARDPQNGGPTDIWTHQVVVLIPNVVKHRNVSMAYLTGSCNNKPSVPKPTDEEVSKCEI